MISSCDEIIMAPMPQEKPVTTACGTRVIWRPSRNTQKPIMITEATIETFAAPPMPWVRTASAMKGTVALAVPPMRTGLRPRRAITGAVTIDVKTPSTGGSPINDAMASP